MEIPCLCLRHKEALHPSVTQVVNTPNVPIAHAFQFGPFVRIPFSALGLHGGQRPTAHSCAILRPKEVSSLRQR